MERYTTLFEVKGERNALLHYTSIQNRCEDHGWYDGSDSRWSTDYKRQKLFDKKHDAGPVCDELRRRCPRNARAINIEAEHNDPSLDPDAQPRARQLRERTVARERASSAD
jgi:hypothetical protein